MQMANRQKGMTGIGWLIVLGLIGFFTLLTLKIVPSYMEYYKISSALEKMPKETGMADASPMSIRKALERQFDIGYVTVISAREVKVTPAGSNFDVRAQYEDRVHLFGNVDVIMSYDKSVKVPRT